MCCLPTSLEKQLETIKYSMCRGRKQLVIVNTNCNSRLFLLEASQVLHNRHNAMGWEGWYGSTHIRVIKVYNPTLLALRGGGRVSTFVLIVCCFCRLEAASGKPALQASTAHCVWQRQQQEWRWRTMRWWHAVRPWHSVRRWHAVIVSLYTLSRIRWRWGGVWTKHWWRTETAKTQTLSEADTS